MKTQFLFGLFSYMTIGLVAMEPGNPADKLIMVHVFNRVSGTPLKMNCCKYYVYGKENYFCCEEYKSQLFDIKAHNSTTFNIRPDSFGMIDIDFPTSDQAFTWIYYWRSAYNKLHIHKMGTKFMDTKSITVDLIEGLDALGIVLQGSDLQESFVYYPNMPPSH